MVKVKKPVAAKFYPVWNSADVVTPLLISCSTSKLSEHLASLSRYSIVFWYQFLDNNDYFTS